MIINNLEEIKEAVEDFFKRTGVEANIDFLSPKESNFLPKEGFKKNKLSSCLLVNAWENKEKVFVLPIELKVKEPQVLIGEKGQTLTEIQYLLRIFLNKKFNYFFLIDLDINNYKKKKIEYLKEAAMSLADDAVFSKKEKWFPLMPPYERRVIHIELSKRSDVKTESVGHGLEKKILIKPCF